LYILYTEENTRIIQATRIVYVSGYYATVGYLRAAASRTQHK